jgi:hypothetical protein
MEHARSPPSPLLTWKQEWTEEDHAQTLDSDEAQDSTTEHITTAHMSDDTISLVKIVYLPREKDCLVSQTRNIQDEKTDGKEVATIRLSQST